MKAKQYLSSVDDGVTLLTPPKHRLFQWRRSANVVIINGRNGVTVIDSGGTSMGSLLTSVLGTLYGDIQSKVFCQHTHGHIDHIAGSSRVVNELNASIHASRGAAPFVKEQAPINMTRERPHMMVSFRELFSAPEWFVNGMMRLGMGKGRELQEVIHLEDDPDPGETGFRPISLPGHHAGHTGFFNNESGILVSGDMIDPRHKMKPVLTSPSSDWSGMKRAFETVAELEPSTVIPGHGEPIVGVEEVSSSVQKALMTLNDAMDHVLTFLDSAPATLAILSDKMIGMGLGPGRVFRNMFIHSILANLVQGGRISGSKDEKNKTIFAST
ncbi:MAG: MBL fold metallo-hydrolase [Candidatus Thorarchaeota archaeon]